MRFLGGETREDSTIAVDSLFLASASASAITRPSYNHPPTFILGTPGWSDGTLKSRLQTLLTSFEATC